MGTGKHGIIPLAAVAGGVLAGAVGTVCLDAVNYLKYRSGGGKDSPLAWEFPKVERWDQAPAPGQVGRAGQHRHALVLRVGLGGALWDPGRLSAQADSPLWPAVRRGDLGLGLRPAAGGRALQADLGL